MLIISKRVALPGDAKHDLQEAWTKKDEFQLYDGIVLDRDGTCLVFTERGRFCGELEDAGMFKRSKFERLRNILISGVAIGVDKIRIGWLCEEIYDYEMTIRLELSLKDVNG